MKVNLDHKHFLLLLFLSAALSFFLHKEYISLDIQGIHSWRQSQTMWNVRNFVRHDPNILNPRVSYFNGSQDNLLRYEFPIMQWSIAQLQRLFGEKIEIARGFLFSIGIFSVFGMYFLARQHFKNNFVAFVTAFLFQFSPVFFYYTINPIPDNLALAGAIWYLYFILKYRDTNSQKYLITATSFLLLATLAKLPFLMFGIVSAYLFVRNLFSNGDILRFLLIHILMLIPAIAWYAWVMPDWTGNPVMKGIFSSEFSYGNYKWIVDYHRDVMFPKILLYPPVWPLTILGVISLFIFRKKIAWLLSLILITFVYLILELNAISSVHDYYMMPFLPWLFTLCGIGALTLTKLPYYIGHILVFIALVFAPLHTKNFTSDFWSLDKTYFNKDIFLNNERLADAIPDDELCIIVNDVSKYIFSYQVDKMGYMFEKDQLNSETIAALIKHHDVKYMYSDSRVVDQRKSVQKYLDSLLLKTGSVHLYKLKILGAGYCDSAVVQSDLPDYPTNLFYSNCDTVVNEECMKKVMGCNSMKPQYKLEMQKDDRWILYREWQDSRHFDNIPDHGTYRIGIKLPMIHQNDRCENKTIHVEDENGDLIGSWGKWSQIQYTNNFVVGATVPEDIDWAFLYPENRNFFEQGDNVKINTSESKNYENYFLSITEMNESDTNWVSRKWQAGPMPDEINVSAEWASLSNTPMDNISALYRVQLAISADHCPTTPIWTVHEEIFKLYPKNTKRDSSKSLR